MPEASPPASNQFPGYWFHPTQPMVLCENEAEAKALPPGYKNTPYTEEEADAWSKAAARVEDKADEPDEPHARRSHR